MSAELGAASYKADDLKKEIKRHESIANGDLAGIISMQYTLEAVQALYANEKKAESAAKKKPNDPKAQALIAYTAAAARDASYGMCGRKYMRIAGLTGRSRAVYGRAVAIINATKDKK